MGRLTLFVFLLMTFLSCKKSTLVTIQAQDYITGDGSAYAGMEYAVAETWTPYLETKSKIVKTGFLDENGHASFDLKMKNNRSYILGVSQPDNICYGELQQRYLEHEKNNDISFSFLTCGYLSIPSKNVNCVDANDKFQMKYYYTGDPEVYTYTGFTTGETHDWSEVFFINGCVDYSTVNPPVINPRPNGDYTLEWRAIRASGTTSGVEYFTITENDTTTYVIEY